MKKNDVYYKKYRWLPIIVVEIYVGLTFLLYLFGPWEYQTENNFILTVYILFFLLFSYLGYAWGGKVNFCFHMKKWVPPTQKAEKYIKVALVISLIEKIFLLLSCIVQYGMIQISSISVTLAQTYQRMYQGDFADENIIRQIDGLVSWIYIIAICGSCFLWKKLEKKYKAITIINVLLVMIYNLGYLGVQKNIFDNIIYISIAIVLYFLKKGKHVFSIKKIIIYFLIIVAAILILAGFMSARREVTQMGELSALFNYDHILIRYLPDSLKVGIGILISYGTMGYYYFARTLSLPFVWTYGLGSNWGVNQILTQLFGIADVYPLTYGGRLEAFTGIDAKSHWLTIFPWLASDFTFIGALVVMAIVAFIMSKCWKEVLLEENVLSYIMICRFAILYFYILANNQLFITKGEAVSTIVIVLFWLFTRERWKCKREY